MSAHCRTCACTTAGGQLLYSSAVVLASCSRWLSHEVLATTIIPHHNSPCWVGNAPRILQALCSRGWAGFHVCEYVEDLVNDAREIMLTWKSQAGVQMCLCCLVQSHSVRRHWVRFANLYSLLCKNTAQERLAVGRATVHLTQT